MIYKTLYKTDGISDSDRIKNAITANTFKIHDLTLLELLSCCSQYGHHLKYFDINNLVNGTWSDFLCHDEIMIIADIQCFNVTKVTRELISLLNSSNQSNKKYKKLLIRIIAVILKIDSWYANLSKIDNNIANLMSKTINQIIISDFEITYKTLLNLIHIFKSEHSTESLAELYGAWKDFKIDKIEQYKDNNVLPLFKNIIYTLHNSLTLIKSETETYYEDSLRRKDHSADSALMLTFLELFKYVQKEINEIPKNYIQFFYRNILQFPEKGSVPDSVFVTVNHDYSKTGDVPLSCGTKFIAECNDKSLIYASDTDIEIKNIRVKSVYSQLFQKDFYKEPEKSLDVYSGIKIKDYSEVNERQDTCFPLFSDNCINSGSVGKEVSMQIGFAFASRTLFLSEGERKVHLQISLRSGFDDRWNEFLKKKIMIDSQLNYNGDNLNEIKAEFTKLSGSLFTIELTNPDGWYKVEHYLPKSLITDSKIMNNSISIEFLIPANAGPVCTYDKSIHGGLFNTVLPVCKVSINKGADVFPYSLLAGFFVDSVYIDVRVKGVSDLYLYNQYGPLDSNTPFMPFGPIPKKGDGIIIGCKELNNKTVDMTDIEIEWENLPYHENGFNEYYKGYSFTFDNDCFKAKISELCNGEWTSVKSGGQESISLFETEKGGYSSNENGIGPISSTKHIREIKLQNFKQESSYIHDEDFQYTIKSKRGFIKITLTDPNAGFGHTLYTNDVATSFIKKIQNKNGNSIPQPPYTPVIGKIRLNYRAHTVFNFSHIDFNEAQIKYKDSFYHMYPLGVSHLYPLRENTNISLIPELDIADEHKNLKGNLFIGLKGDNLSGNFSLFFKMSDETTSSYQNHVYWFYLSSDKWVGFTQKQILFDTTNGLITSGIITFRIPDDICKNNSTMPEGMYWIRASVSSNTYNFINICTIKENGVRLTRFKNDNDIYIGKIKLPDKTIKKFLVPVPGVDSVIQHGESFGSIASEISNEYVTRISERLRHKKRPTTARDYEQIVLENFPEIFKVKCFPNLSSHNEKMFYPGKILICVIPDLNNNDVIQHPKVNVILIEKIRHYLESISPSSASIEIINPVYEQIQVRCSIRLRETENSGNFLNSINKSISEYISPWSSLGNCNCFGWKIKMSDLQQFIKENDKVDLVTNFSILHKSSIGTQRYHLSDTAEHEDSSTTVRYIQSNIPWSICLPFKQHGIDLIDNLSSVKPNITGIQKMEIGSIFILKGKNKNGNAK